MIRASAPGNLANDLTLQVYLLGTVDFETAVRLQRRLRFDIAETRSAAALIVCEHPPLVSVGRLGSHSHVRSEAGESAGPLRWVGRGGGCILHRPGQLAVYPILPLDRLGLGVPSYVARLAQTCLALISEFSLRTPPHADEAGVWVGNRLITAIGVSVHDWITSFGAYINVHPTLDAFRLVRTAPSDEAMTSIERERRGPVRPAMVRQRLIEHFQTTFGFANVALFTDHPLLGAPVTRHRPALLGHSTYPTSLAGEG